MGSPVSCPDPSGPLPLSTKWPSVLLRENYISCNCGEVPEHRKRSWRCEWHRVTNTLNSDNRKLMQGVQLKAQHIACGTLKLTRLSRWHMLIPWLWPRFNLWFSASGCRPMLLACWPHKDRPCRYWSCPVNTNISGWAFPSQEKSQHDISHSTDLMPKVHWQLCYKMAPLKAQFTITQRTVYAHQSLLFSVGSDSIWFLASMASGI